MEKIIYLISSLIKLALLCTVAFFPTYSSAQQSSLSILTAKAAELGIEKSKINKLQEQANAKGINDDQLTNILEPAIALAEENLPFDNILEKVFEGFAKNVPEHILINVLQKLQRATQQSVGIVDSWLQDPSVKDMVERTKGQSTAQKFRSDMLKSTGRALSQRIPEESVASFMNELKDKDVLSRVRTTEVVTSLNILADLPATTADPEVSKKLIIGALKSGFKSSDLEKLPSAIQIAQNKGQLPSNSIANGIIEQIQAGSPAAEILQNLFDGKIGGGPPAGVPGRPDTPPGRGNNGNG